MTNTTVASRPLYFNVPLTFGHENLERELIAAIKSGTPGYCCFIEANNLTIANRNPQFLQVVRGAVCNSCDGSVVARLLGHIHHEPFESYVGADVFRSFVGMRRFRQFFLGNTPEVLAGLRQSLVPVDPAIAGMKFETLPFRKVEDFDYPAIAAMINADNPDIVWVSLGAPKQEEFMARLKPYLNRGVMMGVGAAFDFHSSTGKIKRAPRWMRRLRLEWLHRAFEEPKKNVPRYWGFIRILPRLIRQEKSNA